MGGEGDTADLLAATAVKSWMVGRFVIGVFGVFGIGWLIFPRLRFTLTGVLSIFYEVLSLDSRFDFVIGMNNTDYIEISCDRICLKVYDRIVGRPRCRI